MDSSRFDALTRRLAARATRRTALAGLAAALTRLLPGTAVAAQPRTTCRELGKVCIPERNIDCCRGTVCRNGRCRCGEGKRRCQGECRSVRRCCGDECGGGAVCRDGRCLCPSGTKRCRSRCIRKNACCGGCPAGQACRSGRCVRRGCGAGTKPCNGGCIATDACCGGCADPAVCRNGSCCPLGTSVALQAALHTGPETIRLCPNTTYVGTFSIERDVTIIGAGPESSVLNANQTGRVIGISSGAQVTLRGLRVTGGRVDDGVAGGIVLATGADLTLDDVEVSDNVASRGGGSIYVDSATLILMGGSRVANNTASGGTGGGIFGGSATIELRDTSEVIENGAEFGGGIYAFLSAVTLLEQSRLHDNTATQLGGGIYLKFGSELSLQGQSAITENQARQDLDDSGGGIFSIQSTVTPPDPSARVRDNTPDNCQPDRELCT